MKHNFILIDTGRPRIHLTMHDHCDVCKMNAFDLWNLITDRNYKRYHNINEEIDVLNKSLPCEEMIIKNILE